MLSVTAPPAASLPSSIPLDLTSIAIAALVLCGTLATGYFAFRAKSREAKSTDAKSAHELVMEFTRQLRDEISDIKTELREARREIRDLEHEVAALRGDKQALEGALLVQQQASALLQREIVQAREALARAIERNERYAACRLKEICPFRANDTGQEN